MGSKKLKKKKMKLKKEDKIQKSKATKRNKSNSLNICNHLSFENNLLRNGNSYDRLTDMKKYSRSCINDKYISKVNHFSEIREYYFSYLQRVLKDNCAFYNSEVTREMLNHLSLEIEQYALLACLQADIYEKSMNKIIGDIKRCTEEKQIHSEIKKLLPELPENETVLSNKTENIKTVMTVCETYSQIPIISNTRADYLGDNENNWSEEGIYNPDSVSYFTSTDQCHVTYPEMQAIDESQTWIGQTNYSESSDTSQWNYFSVSETNRNNFPGVEPQNNNITVPPVFVQNGDDICSRQIVKNKPISRVVPQTAVENKTNDPLLESRTQLQKSVEETLNNSEKINKQRKEEKERAYIAHILEGEDSLDDRYDSLSDNDNESKENVEATLADRLEKMRELFGMEEEDKKQTTVVNVKSQTQNNQISQVNNRCRRPTIWRYEKIIQLYKYSMLSSEMTFERQSKNRILFLELFGEDSDEENEIKYRCEEKYRSSCTERISSWVVKYLMPYYHEKRIVGRSVFKSLGHYISDTIVDKIQYPDEWTVKYFVSKFFPPSKVYFCDADVLTFNID